MKGHEENEKRKRREEKARKITNWYKNNMYFTVVFVPCTARSTPANRLKEVEARGSKSREWRVNILWWRWADRL